jgi:hypothetical protein
MFLNKKCPDSVYNKLCELFYKFTPSCEREMVDELFNRFHMQAFATWAPLTDHERVLKYFQNTVIPHKIEVMKAGDELLGNREIVRSLRIDEHEFHTNLLLHDLSKFSDNESFGYAEYNFKEPQPHTKMAFECAWHHHKMNNPHHPEHWLNPNRSGELEILPMQNIYILEMIADWIGAGRTYGSTLEQWLPGNFHKFKFHPQTLVTVISILSILGLKDIVEPVAENRHN